jgi:hypothetical protein
VAERRFVCSIDELPPGGMKLADMPLYGLPPTVKALPGER